MTEPKITPLARRLAEENGIDWRKLEGTGPDGTIVERDILAFLAKVMAGEVELPPEPTEAPPPEAVPDMRQVQEALAREGVDLGDLVPETPAEEPAPPPTPPHAEEVFVEEEAFFELDFEEGATAEEPLDTGRDEEAAALADEGWSVVEPASDESSPWVEAAPAGDAAPAAEPDWSEISEVTQETEAAPFEWEVSEEGAWEGAELAAEPSPEEAAEAEAFEATAFSDTPVEEPLSTEAEPVYPNESISGLEEPAEPSWPLEPEEAPTPEGMGEPDVAEAGFEEPLPTEAGFTEEAYAAGEGPAEASMPPVAFEEETAPETETPTADAGAPGAAFPPAFRRAVDLSAAERARADLSTAWRAEVPLELLLFRAVERALAELEVPMRPLLGRFQGEDARGLAVPPARGLRDLHEQLQNTQEEGEGLIVLDLSETPYAEVILPERALVTLGRAGLPEGLGLLSVSGELPTDRTRFLERVAFYLERPILLA